MKNPQHTIQRSILVALLVFGLSSVCQFWTVRAQEAPNSLTSATSDELETVGQLVSAKDPCTTFLETLAKSPPTPPSGSSRVMQLVNCSNQALLGAANAAGRGPNDPNPTSIVPVFPREGTWVMEPLTVPLPTQPPFNNVLTIDIPQAWEDTKCHGVGSKACAGGIVGPRLWARTGCRTNNAFDKAQCETGGCSGRYDCSLARLANPVPTTVSEWTLAEPPAGQTSTTFCASNPQKCLDHPDVSAVDGANLNMDIRQVGGATTNPTAGTADKMWLAGTNNWNGANSPLVAYGQDLRSAFACDNNVHAFNLKRSDLVKGDTVPPQAAAGFVIVNNLGTPVGGDSTIACFSNCGKFAFGEPFPNPNNAPFTAGAPQPTCDTSDPRCYLWKVFCAGDPSLYQPTLSVKCDPQAKNPTGDTACNNGTAGSFVFQSCWANNGDPAVANKCNARGFTTAGSNGIGTCLSSVCRFPNSVLPGAQPPFGTCKEAADKVGLSVDQACIGDDTIHNVMPGAYTWPNDPQVYGGNASVYQVVMAPGGVNSSGTSTIPAITPISPIPLCSQLDTISGSSTVYNYANGKKQCANVIAFGANFGIAKRTASNQSNWDCDLDPTGSGDNGVICRWDDSLNNKIQQIGLRANFNVGPQSNSLQLQVVPGIQNNDLLIASITFAAGASPTAPNGWTLVPGASATSTNNVTTVWYHLVTNASAEPASYTWNWSAVANPSGGLTAWRGVATTTQNGNLVPVFDGTTIVNNGTNTPAVAPSITTSSSNSQLLSVFGTGGAPGLSFALPTNGSVIDMTGAVKVGTGGANVFAHLVGDRIQAAGATDQQSVNIAGATASTFWTSISFAFKAANP